VIACVLLLPELGVSTMGLFLDGKWFMFAAGALVYYALNYAPRGKDIWLCLPLGCALLWPLAKPELLLLPRINEPNQSYFAAFAFAFVLVLLHRWDSVLAKARYLRPLRYCGEMCYSLYLIHWPVVTLVGWAFSQLRFRNPWVVFSCGLLCCLSVAMAAARVFHRWVERRFWNPGYEPHPRNGDPPRLCEVPAPAA
ncbi:MAG: acyltransferase family protein, partial [Limisphaerales bacterium]